MSKSEPGDLPFMTLTVKSIPPAFVKKELKLPLFLARIPAGFSSPAGSKKIFGPEKNVDF